MHIPPNARFVLVNDSAGADVTDAFRAQTAAAVNHVLQNAFKAAWGGDYMCRAGSPTLAAGEVKVSLQASSDVQGAAGYHDDGGIYCFRDGLSLTGGAFGFDVVIAHEIFEAALDPGANQWADNGNGEEVAKEACDVVEGFCFQPPGQAGFVSDFLLPSYFDPTGERPFSHLDKPTAPFTIAPDGGANYQIVRSVDENGEQQVTATKPHPDRLGAKRHPSSRTSRRGVSLA